MAHVLSITDGTTTAPLSTTSAMLSSYVPGTPDAAERGIVPPVTEPVEVLFYGANTTAARAALNVVERLLVQAERRQQTGTGARVYLQFQPDGDATAYRSEIIAGMVQLAPKSLQVFGQAQINARIIVTRVPYWEGARTQIPLTNGNGTNNTSGLSINNRSGNWVGISSANVTGVLPAPLELQLVNTTGAGRNYYNFYASVNDFNTALAHHIEGETATDTAGTTTSNANSSASNYLSFSVVTTTYATLVLSTTLLQQTAGRFVRVVARLQTLSATGTVYCTPSVWDYYNLVPLWVGNEVALNGSNYLLDLGVVPLPPGGYVSGYGELRMRLTFRNTSGTATVGLDYVQLLPSDPLCWRHVIQRGMVVANNSYMVDDGIEGVAYLVESGAANPIYSPVGAPAHVWPNRDQRLYILHDGIGQTANWTLSVRAYYRPRRVTI